jgi:hypothetical protein
MAESGRTVADSPKGTAMKRLSTLLVGLVIVLHHARPCPADGGSYRSLLRRLPDSTTAVVLIDVKGLRQALGVAPGTALSSAGISGIPVLANEFVVGAHIDLSERRHVWSVALAQIDGKMTLQDLAKIENEPIQKVGTHSAIVSPRNVYFVDLGQNLLAAATPANRKMLTRWLNFQDTNQLDTLSPYLIQAAKLSDGAVMVMTIDVEDSVDMTSIRRGLTRSQVLASRENVDLDAVARTLARARGAKLTIRPGSPLQGDLTVEFDTDTGTVRDFAKPLLLEMLQNTGLYVEDFDGWELQLKDRSVGIHGPLSVNALRKFGTLIQTPAPSPEAADPAAYQATGPAARSLTASQRYFQSITRYLDDLKNDKSKNMSSRAGWADHAASQIFNLPTLDVAPELVTYGVATAEQLNGLATGLKDSWTRLNFVHNNSFYCDDGWVYGNRMTGFTTTKRAMDEVRSQSAEARRLIWERIDDATAQTRRLMTQKFNTQF